MYDKVSFWVDRAATGGQYEAMAAYLDAPKEQTDLSTGEITLFGGVGGLKVTRHTAGVSIVGSLPKFLYDGSNIPALDRHTTAQAIERISDTLHFDMSMAKVTGFEFGRTFIMQHPVSAYLVRLGEMKRRERVAVAHTLYYQHRGEAQPDMVCFYDKGIEARKSGIAMPVGLDEGNLLRYEIRYKGRLPQQMNYPKVEASTLAEKTFYGQMVGLYSERYFSIKKQNQSMVDVTRIKSVSDAIDVLFAHSLNMVGQDTAERFLEELKAANVFSDRKYYTRVKEKIESAKEKAGAFSEDTLIKELDDEVKNACIYA